MRADVPELPFPDGADIFELFWCPLRHRETWDAPVDHRWLSSDRPLEPRFEPIPSRAAVDDPVGQMSEADLVPRAALLSPERVVDLPSAFALDLAVTEEIDRWLADNAGMLRSQGELPPGDPGMELSYQYHFSCSVGTKVGGHPDWIQDPWIPDCTGCGQETQHLLTVQSWEWDGASWWRWMPAGSELRDWKLNQRPGDPPNMAMVEEDRRHGLGLMIGDAGATYVFYCSACDLVQSFDQFS
jgi:hypothetical protein